MSTRKSFYLLALLCCILANSTSFSKTNTVQFSGIDTSNFDTKTAPCDDFYKYVNGTWIQKNPVPNDYTSWNVFTEIEQNNQKILKQIAETAASQDHKPGTDTQLIGDFYATAMDTSNIENVGLTPLQPLLNKIAEIKSHEDVQNTVTAFHNQGLSALFLLDADDDLKNSKKIIAYLYQDGLGLPSRDDYIKNDAESQKIRAEYKKHLIRNFELLGFEPSETEAKADAVLKIETQLAKASLSRVEERDPQNFYKLVSIDEAGKITPHFDWKRYFKDLGIKGPNQFSMSPIAFFNQMELLLANESPENWQAYFQWHLLRETSRYLNADFENENFRFYEQFLNGSKTMLPRWKRSLAAIDENLGEVMGKLFVKDQFPENAKKTVLGMIHEILAVYKTRIENLDWMEDSTKTAALKKLKTFSPKIGYPDRWRSYQGLEIRRDSYVENVLRTKAFAKRTNLNKIGKNADQTEWGMNPHEINAYYNPTRNEIVFPAGILQPPFFDFNADPAVNYGAIGAIIGHEITHGFDDEGSQYDAHGNLKNWWTENDKKEFAKRSQVLVQQYGRYQPLPGYFVNGQLTLGENIADLGGLSLAHDALQITLKKNPSQNQLKDGFTPEKRFFMSWAQGWRLNRRPENVKLRLKVDAHAPAKFRVNGVVANLPSFQQAFSCKDSDAMMISEKKRAKIW